MPFSTAHAYAVLGVQPQTSPAGLRDAYLRLARRVHPDVNPAPDAAARMAELSNAYHAVLSRLALPAPARAPEAPGASTPLLTRIQAARRRGSPAGRP